MTPKQLPSIAVFNSSEDTIEFLKVALEEQGYAVTAAHARQIARVTAARRCPAGVIRRNRNVRQSAATHR